MSSLQIGRLRVERVEEMSGPAFAPHDFLVGLPEDAVQRHMDWLAPNHFDIASGKCISSVHSWIVRTTHHTVLIDSCCGNHKNREGTGMHQLDIPWLERLSDRGVRPEDVDFVMCTHLHPDHVGWNTKLLDGRWVPTFPNAKYIFGKREHDYWSSPEGMAVVEYGQKGVLEDSVLPCIEAGQAVLVDDGYAVDDNLIVENAPGHTPGAITIRATSGSQGGLFSGDAMHTALQVVFPDSNSIACHSPELARATRRNILSECADRGYLLLPAHFGLPHFGRVTRDGDSFRFHDGA
jgi:glyoxylase-like metal-dependent hydrolase (beta-lactamase superfamily II)